jgi:hypothetical protein
VLRCLQLIDFGLTKHIESAQTMLVGTTGEMQMLQPPGCHWHAIVASAKHEAFGIDALLTAWHAAVSMA